MRKTLIALVALAALSCAVSFVYAEESASKDSSVTQLSAAKFARGIINIATGWVELPKNIYDTSKEVNMLNGMTEGLAKGIAMTIMRTGAGIYDAATFPFPNPEEYVPVLEPEFVFTKAE